MPALPALGTRPWKDQLEAWLLSTHNADGSHSASLIGSTATGDVAATNVQAAIAELASEKQAISAKGTANGYASLDGAGLVRAAQLPAMNYVPLDGVVVAGTRIFANKLLVGDAQPSFRILGDGKHEWGPGGATAPDTRIYRLT